MVSREAYISGQLVDSTSRPRCCLALLWVAGSGSWSKRTMLFPNRCAPVPRQPYSNDKHEVRLHIITLLKSHSKQFTWHQVFQVALIRQVYPMAMSKRRSSPGRVACCLSPFTNSVSKLLNRLPEPNKELELVGMAVPPSMASILLKA